MASLSVIMIVKNEAAVLPACLESVAGIADEIVIADTGSTDDTIAVARRFGATVFELPWRNDFAEARNAGMSRASGDWLLHMDADEVLDPRGALALRELIEHDTETDAAELVLANYCNDPRAWRWVAAPQDDPLARGFAGYLPVRLLRLFRNGRGFEYREAVHENITESVRERGGRIRATDIVIHHYGYEVDPARRAQKARFYYDLARDKAARHPADPKSLHDLAEQALACGDEAAAEGACRRVLAIAPDHLAAATTLANIYLNRGDLDSAEAVLSAQEVNGEAPPHVQTALGAIALRRGNWDEAGARLEAVRAACAPAPMATLYLARCLDLRGESTAAEKLLAELSQQVPALEEVDRRLRALEARREGEACFARGDLHDALRCFVRGLALDPEDVWAHNNIGVVLYQLGEVPKARDAFDRALKLSPTFEPARENLNAAQRSSG